MNETHFQKLHINLSFQLLLFVSPFLNILKIATPCFKMASNCKQQIIFNDDNIVKVNFLYLVLKKIRNPDVT